MTNGGRVLGVTAKGKDLKEARKNAYAATEWVQFENKYMRHDIGKAIGRGVTCCGKRYFRVSTIIERISGARISDRYPCSVSFSGDLPVASVNATVHVFGLVISLKIYTICLYDLCRKAEEIKEDGDGKEISE